MSRSKGSRLLLALGCFCGLCLLQLLQLPTPAQARGAARRHRPPGRHVCVENKTVTRPLKEVESYCKPVYKSQAQPCSHKDRAKFCTSFRVVYERAFRTVYKMTASSEEQLSCCPGWSRHHPRAHGCSKPVCSDACQNGGSCSKPDHCLCLPGWTGKLCHDDVNECKQEERSEQCAQRCLNTRGSYRCACHQGFTLEPDGKNCRIAISQIPEIQEFIQGYEELSSKIQDLEMSRQNLSEIVNRLDDLSRALSSLRQEMRTPQTTTVPEVEPTTKTAATPTTTTMEPPTDNVLPTLYTEDSRYGSPWDRINSLSDQISMLEERLDDCTCDHVEGSRSDPVK